MGSRFVSGVVGVCLLAALVGLSGCASEPEGADAVSLQFPLERTEARMERGEYLVSSVVLCLDCHSETDWAAPGSPLKPGTVGGGGVFELDGLPGRVIASNISPDKETGAGDWSDEDFYKAMTEGVGKDGRTLFPIMPAMHFRQLSDEDLASIIVYVRSIEPIRNALPKTELPEPVKQSLQPLPPRPPMAASDSEDQVKHGAYLVNAALCAICHTPPRPDGSPQPGMEFSGGWLMQGPWGSATPTNITPDASGISYYDEQIFIETIRTGRVKGARELSVLMPSRFYRNMTDQDLQAIFAYLRTLKPVSHRVDNTESVAPCTRCGFPHGLGAMN